MPNPIRLSTEDFEKSFELAPRVAISLAIKNAAGELSLVKRSYPPFEGDWYLPGSFIMKNETFFECAKRVAKDELDIDLNDEGRLNFLGIFEMIGDDKRGHSIDMEYELTLSQDEAQKLHPVEEWNFFRKLPTPTFSGHRKALVSLGYK